MQEMWASSHLFGGHATYLESLYSEYQDNPKNLSEEWLSFFEDFSGGVNDISHQDIIDEFKNMYRKPSYLSSSSESINEKQGKVIRLIQSYRNRGHLVANLDPLGIMKNNKIDDLDPKFHHLNQDDLNKEFYVDTFLMGPKKAKLKDIIQNLKKVYCGNIGIEYNYITNYEERRWFQKKFESKLGNYSFSDDERVSIFERLNSAEGLASYLAAKYPGMKRFGIDGAESLVPLIDSLIQNCGQLGANQICFGMAHRGRLNLLVNVLGKMPSDLFSSFDEGIELEGANTGDVKYHLGFSSNIMTPGGEVHVSLSNNPSHLEIVDPVVLGSVRARQDRLKDFKREKVIPILVHGDASFSGQGVVMECLQMSQTRGFSVGGTIHIVVNNQIGFTTSHKNDSRSTEYSTDVAKVIQAPVVHVNGDDPEMVVNAVKIASQYRKKFKKDIIIDLFCYRRRGHNEADDPFATQPLMYKVISKHSSVLSKYREKLISQKVISKNQALSIKSNYRKALDSGQTVAKNLSSSSNKSFWFDWSEHENILWWPKIDTSFNLNKFKDLGKRICEIPDFFILGTQANKVFSDRIKMSQGGLEINWGFSEIMSYATLLSEGYPIRISGQDVRRGTFSHRHAAVFDNKTGREYIPLSKIANDENTLFDIYDSLLSEEAVLGFEYGYSATWPSGLTIWEAQFGDFMNGAQVVIDQFIVSAEHKWSRLSGLVLLLPHGYEGQGPEHSSARIERFLQLCASENIQVCIPSSPSQIFHLLRRQAIRKMRTPLVVMTPKSLLRSPNATSTIEELTDGSFRCVIDDTIKNKDNISKVILCSGKIFYELRDRQREVGKGDTAIIRIEQLYPFPYDDLEEILLLYKKIKKIIWCQEEPYNQGAWFSHRHRIQRVLDRINFKKELNLVSRPPAAAPAVGIMKLHLKQQRQILEEAIR